MYILQIRAANAVVSWEQNLEKVRQMLSISEKLVNYIATQVIDPSFSPLL